MLKRMSTYLFDFAAYCNNGKYYKCPIQQGVYKFDYLFSSMLHKKGNIRKYGINMKFNVFFLRKRILKMLSRAYLFYFQAAYWTNGDFKCSMGVCKFGYFLAANCNKKEALQIINRRSTNFIHSKFVRKQGDYT